jgi:hypothetical protein
MLRVQRCGWGAWVKPPHLVVGRRNGTCCFPKSSGNGPRGLDTWLAKKHLHGWRRLSSAISFSFALPFTPYTWSWLALRYTGASIFLGVHASMQRLWGLYLVVLSLYWWYSLLVVSVCGLLSCLV